MIIRWAAGRAWSCLRSRFLTASKASQPKLGKAALRVMSPRGRVLTPALAKELAAQKCSFSCRGV